MVASSAHPNPACWRNATGYDRAVVALRFVVVLCVCLAAFAQTACNDSSEDNEDENQAGVVGTETEPPTVAAPAGDPARLGCGQYCRQAAPYGGDEGGKAELVSYAGPDSVQLAGDLVPVEVECNAELPCRGSITLFESLQGGGGGQELGRSDLEVPAGGTRNLGVELNVAGRRMLDAAGQLAIRVALDADPTHEELPEAEQEKTTSIGLGELTLTAP